jgi:hypothetical protein
MQDLERMFPKTFLLFFLEGDRASFFDCFFDSGLSLNITGNGKSGAEEFFKVG